MEPLCAWSCRAHSQSRQLVPAISEPSDGVMPVFTGQETEAEGG